MKGTTLEREEPAAASTLTPSRVDLERIFALKHGRREESGWGPRLRLRYDYFTPDEWYEALVDRLVREDTTWLDVGCGRSLFPSNRELSRELAGRCRRLVGLDPDDTLDENPYVHERVKADVCRLQTERKFDLVTLRMVAEHIAEPDQLVQQLSQVVPAGGRVVIYTVYRWSPVPIITALTPFSWHHRIKKILWRTEARDTFPTVFRMNTRRALRSLFARQNFEEEWFRLLDDCRSFQRFRLLNHLELLGLKACRTLGLGYPERCILGVFRRR